MPRIGIQCVIDLTPVDDHTCLQCRTGTARAGTHCHFSYEMLKGMMDSSGRTSAHISATMLTAACQRKVWLEKREDYHVNPIRMFPAWRGTMGHLMTEAHPAPNIIYEHRFELDMTIDDIPLKITGQIDKLDIDGKKIEDFKTKADAKMSKLRQPEPAHIWQLNIYKYLVKYGWPQQSFKHGSKTYKPGKPAGIAIEELKLTYWSMQEPRAIIAPIYDEKDVESFIREKAANLVGECPDIPDNLDPHVDKLCTDWCPVRSACMERHIGF
jgi:hypothetical protein